MNAASSPSSRGSRRTAAPAPGSGDDDTDYSIVMNSPVKRSLLPPGGSNDDDYGSIIAGTRYPSGSMSIEKRQYNVLEMLEVRDEEEEDQCTYAEGRASFAKRRALDARQRAAPDRRDTIRGRERRPESDAESDCYEPVRVYNVLEMLDVRDVQEEDRCIASAEGRKFAPYELCAANPRALDARQRVAPERRDMGRGRERPDSGAELVRFELPSPSRPATALSFEFSGEEEISCVTPWVPRTEDEEEGGGGEDDDRKFDNHGPQDCSEGSKEKISLPAGIGVSTMGEEVVRTHRPDPPCENCSGVGEDGKVENCLRSASSTPEVQVPLPSLLPMCGCGSYLPWTRPEES